MAHVRERELDRRPDRQLQREVAELQRARWEDQAERVRETSELRSQLFMTQYWLALLAIVSVTMFVLLVAAAE
jgi:hypothetical protein